MALNQSGYDLFSVGLKRKTQRFKIPSQKKKSIARKNRYAIALCRMLLLIAKPLPYIGKNNDRK